MQSIESQPTFQRNMPAFTLVTCLTYSSLKMEAISSSEMSVDFQWTIGRYISKDSNLYINLCR
jgi:hypothetical protein